MKKKSFLIALFVFCVAKTAFGQSMGQKAIYNENCERLCGSGYFYDRPGAKRNGRELVCTKYPLSCGYECTIGWAFRYLVDGTDYTCQEAIQFETGKEEKSLIKARSL